MVSAAKPMLMRSRNATIYSRKSRGMRRFRTLRTVSVEMSVAVTGFPAAISINDPSAYAIDVLPYERWSDYIPMLLTVVSPQKSLNKAGVAAGFGIQV